MFTFFFLIFFPPFPGAMPPAADPRPNLSGPDLQPSLISDYLKITAASGRVRARARAAGAWSPPLERTPAPLLIYFFAWIPRAALFSTRPGGERGEVGLQLTRPAPPQSSGPRRGPELRASPSSLPAGLSPEKLGTWGGGSPWASRSIPALCVWWAVRGGLCALCLGAPVFPGVRSTFPKLPEFIKVQ